MSKHSITPCGPLTKHRAGFQPSLSRFSATALAAGFLLFQTIPASAQYRQYNLVSDKAGLALHTDGNLLDPWGMARLPGGGFIVADALSGFVTFYKSDGTTLRPPVTVPAAPGLPAGTPGSPAGLVATCMPAAGTACTGRSPEVNRAS